MWYHRSICQRYFKQDSKQTDIIINLLEKNFEFLSTCSSFPIAEGLEVFNITEKSVVRTDNYRILIPVNMLLIVHMQKA